MTAKKQLFERRRNTRKPVAGAVTVRLFGQDVVGPAENISPDGVLLMAEASLAVEVTLPGETQPRRGELVRVTSLRGGRMAVAIKYRAV